MLTSESVLSPGTIPFHRSIPSGIRPPEGRVDPATCSGRVGGRRHADASGEDHAGNTIRFGIHDVEMSVGHRFFIGVGKQPANRSARIEPHRDGTSLAVLDLARTAEAFGLLQKVEQSGLPGTIARAVNFPLSGSRSWLVPNAVTPARAGRQHRALDPRRHARR